MDEPWNPRAKTSRIRGLLPSFQAPVSFHGPDLHRLPGLRKLLRLRQHRSLGIHLITELHLNRSTIGNLYTAYSIAAILIVFFGACSTTSWGPQSEPSVLFARATGAVMVAMARASGCCSRDASCSARDPNP